MTFKELQAAMTAAMKERNRVKKDVIADMVACAKNMAIEQGCKDNITDEIVKEAILKSKKRCQEQIDTCPKNRPDLLEAYTVCMGYINEFAPRMMSENEVREYIIEYFEELRTRNEFKAGQVNKGQIMKELALALKGKAEMSMVSRILTEVLKML